MRDHPYDYRNCQSLFGYAASVHARSGGICQLCGCGDGPNIDFDLWRQLTVEHLIGESQGGYPKSIRAAVAQRFPSLSATQREHLVRQIDEANTITACSFCNSTTSRDRAAWPLDRLITDQAGGPEDVLDAVRAALATVLAKKRADVHWKLASVAAAFHEKVEPTLIEVRARTTHPA